MTAIRQTLVKQESIDVHFDDGKSVSINSDQRRLYLHFSGLGDQVIRPGEFGGNTIDINYVDWNRRTDHRKDVFDPVIAHLKSDMLHVIRRYLVQYAKESGNVGLADLLRKSADFQALHATLSLNAEHAAGLSQEWLPVIAKFL